MRLVALTLLSAVAAYKARYPDESVMTDNLYLDPTAEGETLMAKFLHPFDPPRTYGGILKTELEGTCEKWVGRLFLCGDDMAVINEVNPAYLKLTGQTIDHSEDTRRAYREFMDNPEAQAFWAAQDEEMNTVTPLEAIAIYAERKKRYEEDIKGNSEGSVEHVEQRSFRCNRVWCNRDVFCSRFNTAHRRCNECLGHTCYGHTVYGELLPCSGDIC